MAFERSCCIVLHFIVPVPRPIYPSAADMSWRLSVNVNIRETQYALYVGVHTFPNDVCVCAAFSVNVMVKCVKAVREHQVPKIDTPHGKENGGDGEEETRCSHLRDKKPRFWDNDDD